ncbi:MAG: cell division protein FtsQ/DivIB [Planctomycetaceae bacterium]
MRGRRRNVIAVLAEEQPTMVSVTKRPNRSPNATKKRRTTKSSLARDAGPPDEGESGGALLHARRWLQRPKVLAIVALVLCGVTAGPYLFSLLPDPAERKEYRFAIHKIETTPPPPGVPADIVDQVIRQAKIPDDVSLLEADLAENLARAFTAHPWVARVVEVKKSFPARVQVELEYREPVAMVEVAGGLFPVDDEGVLLPPKDFSTASTRRFPLVRGVQSEPQGPAGRSWGDAVVRDVARLARHLGPFWKELELASIVIVGRGAAGDGSRDAKFELHTVDGSRILWGRAPGSDHPGELTAEQKIGRLKKYHHDFGRFDKPFGPYEIDIRHWREITRRPITAAEMPERN